MKRRLAIIVPSMRGGGAERVILNLVSNLNVRKYEIYMVLLQKEGPYLKFLPKSINIIDLKSNRVRYALYKLIKTLNAIRPDIVFSTLGHLNLGILLIRKFLVNKPKIYVREASTPSMVMSDMNSFKKHIFFFLYKKLYRKADLIVAQCMEMKKDIIKTYGIERRKIKYIYNPINIKEIHSKMVEYNPYDKNKINILAVGWCSYQKGFDILINAFELVLSKMDNTQLTILGDGELKSDLIEMVKNKDMEKYVTFVGFKENPYPYYYYSNLYVLSSRWEGFPNSLLEALACNTKIVSTNCKSGPREIIGNNEYGILVNVGDHIALAEGIIKALNEDNRTRDRAYKYNINEVIKKYEQLFDL